MLDGNIDPFSRMNSMAFAFTTPEGCDPALNAETSATMARANLRHLGAVGVLNANKQDMSMVE
jgi:hypothetical protein